MLEPEAPLYEVDATRSKEEVLEEVRDILKKIIKGA